jgi:heme o synthase
MFRLRILPELVQLTKPTIMLLVVLTGAAALVLEGRFVHQPLSFAVVLLALTLAGGSANALNQYFERDIDARMSRTRKKRPLPKGTVTPREALVFAVTIGMASVAIFAAIFNPLSAALAAATILFYGLFYTLYLKPRTHFNIVIGGAAGAMAPVIAWAAATGGMAWTPWILFAIVFLWTPPHFWALALCVKRDYEAVKLPMLPVIKGDGETRRQILLYTLVTVAISLALLLVAAGVVYLLAALVLGYFFTTKAFRVWRARDNAQAWGLFKYSIIYLMTLFVAMIADSVTR